MKVILGTPGLILRAVEESVLTKIGLERKNEFDLEGDTMVWFGKRWTGG